MASITGLLVTSVLMVLLSSANALDRYDLYEKLQDSLLNGYSINASVPNTQVLADGFFPKRSAEPVCIPVTYTLLCNESSSTADIYDDPVQCLQPPYKASYLWTAFGTSKTVITLLYSYAQYGVSLKGFGWDQACTFTGEIQIQLRFNALNYRSDLITQSLLNLTSQLKAIAEAQNVPKVTSDYRGYSFIWDDGKHDIHLLDPVFTVHIIFLNLFIFFFSLASSNLLYNGLYKNVEGRSNPGYSLFWGIVLLSVIWNVAPSWLVLHANSNKVYYSLAVMIPLQFLVAMTVKKKTRFPIPGMKITGCLKHCADTHTFSKLVCSGTRICANHIIQVIALWSLLITFTFFMHYSLPVILSFYIDPLNSLVKLIFVKTVVISLIINLALIFTIDHFILKCTYNAFKSNVVTLVSVLTVLSFMPILVFLIFMIGGIVFTDSPNSSTWKSLFTLAPPALLLFGSWFSRGLLFPQGIKDPADPAEEIVHDLEGNHSAKSPSGGGGNNGHTQVPMGESTPLLVHAHGAESSDHSAGVRSRVGASSGTSQSDSKTAMDG